MHPVRCTGPKTPPRYICIQGDEQTFLLLLHQRAGSRLPGDGQYRRKLHGHSVHRYPQLSQGGQHVPVLRCITECPHLHDLITDTAEYDLAIQRSLQLDRQLFGFARAFLQEIKALWYLG